MPIAPESFNRIREANGRYGAAREALGVVKAVAEANPSEANAALVEAADLEARRALEEFYRVVGAADLQSKALGG
jgi:hypothetical protein